MNILFKNLHLDVVPITLSPLNSSLTTESVTTENPVTQTTPNSPATTTLNTEVITGLTNSATTTSDPTELSQIKECSPVFIAWQICLSAKTTTNDKKLP